MAVENRRRHERIKHRADIQVRASIDVYRLQMRDFSESGMYLLCSDTSIVKVSDQVKVQTLEFDGAPVLDAVVVRLDDDAGFAVEFIQ